MRKVMVIGCGAYMDSGYGCPGEWRCLKAAALGEGKFAEPVQVISLVRCECPGRSVAANASVAMKLSGQVPDVIHMSSCLANAKPDCPYGSPEQFAEIIAKKTGVAVAMGTHDYT